MAEMADLDEWDPMSMDFTDASFNTYTHGPGARLDHSLQPWASTSRNKGPYKLHVANIPLGITKEGLLNIFCRYGDVLSVYKHDQIPGQHITWGFIVFPKHSQAELAIRELHMKKPLYLKVQFALSDSEKQRIRLEREKTAIWGTVSESLAEPDVLLMEAQLRRKSGFNLGRGKFRQVYLKEHFVPSPGYGEKTIDYEHSDEESFEQSLGGQYNELNGLMLQGIHCSLQSGSTSRTVSKGRGFHNIGTNWPGKKRQSSYHSPEYLGTSSDDAENEDHIRSSGKYVYGDPVHLKAGLCRACQFCGRLTSSACARCGDFYCSEECQRKDWPDHKPNCLAAPGIVELSPAKGSAVSNTLLDSSPVVNTANEDSKSVGEHKQIVKDENGAETMSFAVDVNSFNGTQSDSHGDCSKRGCSEGDDGNISKSEGVESGSKSMRDGPSNAGISCTEEPSFRNRDRQKQNNDVQDSNKADYWQGGNAANNQSSRFDIKFNQQNCHWDSSNATQGYNESDKGRNCEQQNRNRNSYGRNDGFRRNNGQRQGNWKQNVDGGGDRNKMPGRNSNQRNNRSSNQYRHADNSGNDSMKRNMDAEEKTDINSRLVTQLHIQKHSPKSLESKPVAEQYVKYHGWPAEECAMLLKDNKRDGINLRVSADKTPLCVSELLKEDLQSNCFTKVKVTLRLSSKQYMVQKVENEAKILENMQLLQYCGERDIFPAEVGKLCAASYEGVWYRAEIVSVAPDVRVFYVDYGNEEICSADTLRSIPQEALALPAQAINIKLAEGTPEKYESLHEDAEIIVKPCAKENLGVTVVMLEGENYSHKVAAVSPQSVVSQPLEKVPVGNVAVTSQAVFSVGCILSLFKGNTEGAMRVRAIENVNQFTGTVVAEPFVDKYRKIYEDLCSYFKEDSPDKVFEPTVGSLIAAQLPADSLWYRASVLSILAKGYRVAFHDIGLSQKVENIRRLPEEFCDIEQMSVRCKIVKYTMPKDDIWKNYLKIGQNVQLSFNDICPTKVTADIIDNSDVVCTIEMMKWVPIPEDRGLKFVKLQNNSSVVLTTFCSPRTIFLRPLDKSAQESFNCVLQDVAGHAVKAPHFESLPVIGEIVACKYNKDKNYYRAKVIGFENDKVVVTYLDFGNTERENLCDIKELSEELKTVPACVVKVQLKDVPDLPLNTQIVEFLSEITLKEKELKVKFVDLKEGVDLFMDGTCLNTELKSLLEPSWQQPSTKASSDVALYMYDNLKYIDLPVGEVISMAVCHAEVPDIIFGFKEGSEVMHYVMTTMQAQIDEYCNKINEESFLPRKYEMCLAEYEGAWYRAACLDTVNAMLVSVLFVDYGNTEQVSFKKIRKMPRDFMEHPVAAVACTVKGIPENEAKASDVLKELVNAVKKVKVLSMTKTGNFVVEIQ